MCVYIYIYIYIHTYIFLGSADGAAAGAAGAPRFTVLEPGKFLGYSRASRVRSELRS